MLGARDWPRDSPASMGEQLDRDSGAALGDDDLRNWHLVVPRKQHEETMGSLPHRPLAKSRAPRGEPHLVAAIVPDPTSPSRSMPGAPIAHLIRVFPGDRPEPGGATQVAAKL